ncbi:MAG: hypothetical protein AB7F40_09940 [Victivallaceae bacterium]|nr:hypothetical protein [Victivallaceae bacterium]
MSEYKNLVISGSSSLILSSGDIASDTILLNGGRMNISSGGIGSGTEILGTSIETIFSGGVAIGTMILNAYGSQVVSRNALAVNTIIYSGGSQGLRVGASATGTTMYGGDMRIHGSAWNTVISGGVQMVYVKASVLNTKIYSGGMQIVSHDFREFAASDKPNVENTEVFFGGTQSIYGTAGTSGTKLHSGAILIVESGCSATGVIADAAATLCYDFCAVISGTWSDGSELSIDQNHSLMWKIGENWSQMVGSGRVADSATIYGSQIVRDGGIANDSVLNHISARQIVGPSGTAYDTSALIGCQIVSGGTAYNTILKDSSLVLRDGGTAYNTTVSLSWGASITVGSGCFLYDAKLLDSTDLFYDFDATITGSKGGSTIVYNRSISYHYSYDFAQTVKAGCSAIFAAIESSGELSVASGGVALDTAVDGGKMVLQEGAFASGITLSHSGSKLILEENASATEITAQAGTRISAAGNLQQLFADGEVYLSETAAADEIYVVNGGMIRTAGTIHEIEVYKGALYLLSGSVSYDIHMKMAWDGILGWDFGVTASGTYSDDSAIIIDRNISSNFIVTDVQIVSDGQWAGNNQIAADAIQIVNDGGVVSGTTVFGKMLVRSGGATYETYAGEIGAMELLSGAAAYGFLAGSAVVAAGAILADSVIRNGEVNVCGRIENSELDSSMLNIGDAGIASSIRLTETECSAGNNVIINSMVMSQSRLTMLDRATVGGLEIYDYSSATIGTSAVIDYVIVRGGELQVSGDGIIQTVMASAGGCVALGSGTYLKLAIIGPDGFLVTNNKESFLEKVIISSGGFVSDGNFSGYINEAVIYGGGRLESANKVNKLIFDISQAAGSDLMYTGRSGDFFISAETRAVSGYYRLTECIETHQFTLLTQTDSITLSAGDTVTIGEVTYSLIYIPTRTKGEMVLDAVGKYKSLSGWAEGESDYRLVAENCRVKELITGTDVDVAGNVSAKINLLAEASPCNIYGGGNDVNVGGTIYMDISSGGYTGTIYGGSRADAKDVSVGDINLSVGEIVQTNNTKMLKYGETAWIVGGGAAAAAALTAGDVTVTIRGAKLGQVVGGAQAMDGCSASVDSVNMIVMGASLSGDLFAGGYAYNGGISTVGSTRLVLDAGAGLISVYGNIYGGGANPSHPSLGGDAIVTGSATVVFSGNGDYIAVGTVSGDGKVSGSVRGEKILEFNNFQGNFSANVCNFDTLVLAGSTDVKYEGGYTFNTICFDFSQSYWRSLFNDGFEFGEGDKLLKLEFSGEWDLGEADLMTCDDFDALEGMQIEMYTDGRLYASFEYGESGGGFTVGERNGVLALMKA